MVYISKATEYNWRKLGNNSETKLTKRANKTQSLKRVVALSYLDYEPANILFRNLSLLDKFVTLT